MRIISGQHKGRRLLAPKNLPVRPTTDRAKEALFNILHHRWDWDQLRCLDLFTGTGNIAYELASRGVNHITAVDQNHHCTQFVTQTARSLEMPITVVKSSVETFLERATGPYDFIFADPPYAFTKTQLEQIVTTVFEQPLLAPNGLLVLEHDKHLVLNDHPRLHEERRYGNSCFSFFE